MKIVSRPEDQVAGSGPYTMKLEFAELQFIASLLYITRLGDGEYKEAAFKLLNTLEEMFDEDFLEEASNDVDLSISILNDQGDVVEQHHNAYICIEV